MGSLLGLGLTILGPVFLLAEPQVRAVSLMLIGWGLGSTSAELLGDGLWFGPLACVFTVTASSICAKLSGREPGGCIRKL